MSAFSSYPDEQTVDFTMLGDRGLYLIAGDTGAGKTTIFDAISFALFGKASGDERGDYQMLRSDFADEKAKTFVEMDFIIGSRRYSIKRTIKKTGQDAFLILPDGTIMSGDRNIKPKIAQIVGLDREQFAQIVMIAQNDFQRFLQSGTDERLKIMRHIFGTETLKSFQERLKSRMKDESDKRQMVLHDFERYNVDVYKRDERFAEWESQIKTDKAELAKANKQLGIYDKKKQTLAADIAVAEELYKKFADLAKYRAEHESHTAKAEEMTAMGKRANRGEIALRKIKPLADEAQKAKANHDSAQADLKSAVSNEQVAKIEVERAAKTIESLPPLEEARNAFSTLSKEWENAANKLKSLTTLQTNRSDIVSKQATLAAAQTDLAATFDILRGLPPITEYQDVIDKTAVELSNEEEKLRSISILQSEHSVITGKKTLLAKEQATFESYCAVFNDANANCLEMEDAFLRSQAGILASNLSDGEPCPVCGSPEHPVPALLSDSNVTEAALKKAREAKNKAQVDRENQSSLCGAINAETETLIKRFVADLSKLIPDATFTTAAPTLRNMKDAAQAAISTLSEKKTNTERALSSLKAKTENATKKREQLTQRIAALQSETDTLTKRFLADFSIYVADADWELTETMLDKTLSQTQSALTELTARKKVDELALNKLANDWDTGVKRKTTAETAAESARTLVAERSINEQKLLRIRDDSRDTYIAALREYDFKDDAEYRATLITDKELSECRTRISNYEKLGDQLNRDIARLEAETEGKKAPDIQNLRAESAAIRAESDALNAKRDEINKRLSKTESALKELRVAAAEFEKVEKSYAAIKQLADAANGKLDFETYAQMAYFERVLHAANLRLQLMSQNRYTLHRKTDSFDGRKRSGLELEVLDAYTGKARSANSLSGGESFMASLSLALGLSDVVQQNAGGIRLDAMFIDEGFGSLDAEVLELAIRTLSEMAGTSRVIGIISHVTELRERIDKQLQIEKTASGSRIRTVV